MILASKYFTLYPGDVILTGTPANAENSVIKNNVKIYSFSHLENTKIENNVTVGPYARLRPGTKLLSGSKVGNFVEVKKSTIGKSSKVNHLSYIGDSNLGSKVNIGAGTITVSYTHLTLPTSDLV